MKLGYMARSNRGSTYHLVDPDKHPRSQLLDKLGARSAQKIYCDTKEGKTQHIGYIIRGEWFTIYEVHEWVGGVK